MDFPLVSVIVPVYNMEPFLSETIEAVLKSNYPNFELILVDDGSTDKSREIATRYAEKDNRIRLIIQVNGGVSKARNTAIENSNGEYILPVDADDLISADYMLKAVEVLQNRPEVKVVSCEAEFFGAKTKPWKLPEFSLKLLARKNMIHNCSMYRKTDWIKSGGYCVEILGPEDWDFWISVLKSGGEVHRLPIVGLYYRIHSNSKRKRTRHLKSQLIAQLNKRHKVFLYKQLAGPLHKSRTWSKFYNRIKQFVMPERIFAKPGYEEFVYNIPENSKLQVGETGIHTYDFGTEELEVLKYSGSYAARNARSAYMSGDETQRIGYYEKKSIFAQTEGFFVRKKNDSKPKASIIIAVYKNTIFLKAVLDSLKLQTEPDFEIIITEDGDSVEMRTFVESYKFNHPFRHLTQKDEGWRKNKALNAAINTANSDWLIFVDGDCVVHARFVEMHIRYAAENRVLAGKRVKLNAPFTEKLLKNTLFLKDIQKQLLRKLFFNKKGIRYIEEGIFVSPDGLFGFIPKIRRINRLKGCNMSFSKKAIEAINGFDEDYVLPAVGEDADLTWRFNEAGFKHFSVRNLAVQYHLDHKKNWINQDENLEKMYDKQSRNEYICKNGLIKK